MNRNLIFVALSLMTWGLGENAFFAFQPLYLQELGATPVMIGAIFGANGLAAALAHIPAGYLSDRFGRRLLMWAAWIFGAVATLIMALSHNLNGFVIGSVLYGLTMFVISPLNSYVTAARGKLSVIRALTLISASFNVGGILGPLVGGFLGDHYGFRSIFLFAAFLFILSTALIFMIQAQPVEQVTRSEGDRRLFANRQFMLFLPLLFLMIFSMYLPQPLSPNFLQNIRGLSLSRIGQLYSISGLGIVVLNLVLGQLNVGVGFLLSQAAVGAFCLFIWQGNGMLAYGLGYILVGGFRTARSFAIAQIRPMIHEANMGLAYGVSESVGALALILAAPLAGYLYDRNPEWIYALSFILILMSITLGLVFQFQRPTIKEDRLAIEETQP